MCDRLLAVDILAVADRLKAIQRVPMIGSSHNHGIDILACAQLTIIPIDFQLVHIQKRCG